MSFKRRVIPWGDNRVNKEIKNIQNMKMPLQHIEILLSTATIQTTKLGKRIPWG